MADVAAISVVASATVVITTTLVNVWAGERRARRASEWAQADDARKQSWAREDELRAVLEGASTAFHRTHTAISAGIAGAG